MSRKKQVNQKITALYCSISLEDGGDNESCVVELFRLDPEIFALLVFISFQTQRKISK